MIRTLFAVPVIFVFYGLVFAAYLFQASRLLFTGRLVQLHMVNTIFGLVCNLFWLDLADWVAGRGLGKRLDDLIKDFE